MSIPTPHLEMKSKEEVAKTVLMPGDPLRAKLIADNFLENPIQINAARNVLGYTGNYEGRRISVIASGMGMPSIGIYSYELYKFYDVDNIIRIGSCGAYKADLNLYDVVLADKVWSESSYAKVQNGFEGNTLEASLDLNERLVKNAKELNIELHRGVIHSSDVFYREEPNTYKMICEDHGCIAVEMEAFSLFSNAIATEKKAACLLTVSDSLVKNETTTMIERQNSFTNMMKIALKMA